jgi:hypothetical protein
MPNVTDKRYHIVLYRIQLTRVGFELTTSVVIGTDCIGSYTLSVINPTTIRSRPRWPFQSVNTDPVLISEDMIRMMVLITKIFHFLR